MKRISALLATAVCAVVMTTTATAAIPVYDEGSGLLAGFDDVSVNHPAPTLYDVRFVDGTYDTVFAGGYGLAFGTSYDLTGATNASLALDQLLVDGPLGQLESVPALIFGCAGTPSYCALITPYAPATPTTVSNFFYMNYPGATSDQFAGSPNDPRTRNTAIDSRTVWATWTPAAVVPVPAAGWLLGSALVGLATGVWRRRRSPGGSAGSS